MCCVDCWIPSLSSSQTGYSPPPRYLIDHQIAAKDMTHIQSYSVNQLFGFIINHKDTLSLTHTRILTTADISLCLTWHFKTPEYQQIREVHHIYIYSYYPANSLPGQQYGMLHLAKFFYSEENIFLACKSIRYLLESNTIVFTIIFTMEPKICFGILTWVGRVCLFGYVIYTSLMRC